MSIDENSIFHSVVVLYLAKMGNKGSETTEEERKIIIRLHNQCKSLAQISTIVGRARSTIQSIIDRFCTRRTVKNAPRSGRPHVLSKTDERFIVRLIKKDPKISAPTIAATMEERGVHVSISTLRNILRKNGYHGRVMRKKFLSIRLIEKNDFNSPKNTSIKIMIFGIKSYSRMRVNLIFLVQMEDVQCGEKKIVN